MPTFAKKILIAAAAAAVLAGVALLGVNVYLQSDGVQSRIKEAATRSLGAPVDLRGSVYTPWGGFQIKEITVPDPTGAGKPLLQVGLLRIRFAWLPLLQGRMVVREVELRDPVLVARQSEDRQWALLVPPPPSAEVPVTVPRTGPSGGAGSFKVEIENIRISNARASFIDHKGRTLLRFENADASARVSENSACEGNFEFELVELGRSAKFRRMKGPFTWDGTVLEAPQIDGALAGGRVSANYRMVSRGEKEFQTTLAVDGASLATLAEEAGATSDGTAGKLVGKLELAGRPGDRDSLAGKSRIDLVEARVKPVDFLVQVGTMLGIEELRVLELSEAFADLAISGRKVHLDRLRLRSENLILTGEGTISMEGGRLDLDAALLVNKNLQKKLRAVLGENFHQSDDPEYKQLDFEVTNTLANPKTDLLEKLVGMKVGRDLGGVIKNLFGPPRKKAPDNPAAQ